MFPLLTASTALLAAFVSNACAAAEADVMAKNKRQQPAPVPRQRNERLTQQHSVE
jgi:hypothetical protein